MQGHRKKKTAPDWRGLRFSVCGLSAALTIRANLLKVYREFQPSWPFFLKKNGTSQNFPLRSSAVSGDLL
jgi:hypothetical protein